MDCRHADLLMLFSPRDLVSADSLALEAHLQSCAACTARHAASRSAETSLRRSFAAVPMDAAAKARTRSGLLHRQAAMVRRRMLNRAGLPASLLLIFGLGLGVRHQLRPTLDAGDFAYREQILLEAPQQAVELWLADRRLPVPPFDLNFDLYLTHGTQTIDGREVPVMTFVRPVPGGERVEMAKVYAVRRADFHLDRLKDAQASLVNATVIRPADRVDLVWVVIHTTPTMEPFLKPRGQDLASAS